MTLTKRRFLEDTGGGSPSFADGFILTNGQWFYGTGNVSAPNGYAVSSDGVNFSIDTAVLGGLSTGVVSDRPYVAYP